jgi:ATP-dependent Clp protease protease subunit
MIFPPIVVERSGRSEYSYDIYSRLLKDRIVFLGEEITSETASLIIAQFLYLHNADQKADIAFYIMSPGGLVNSGLAIYDTMQLVSNDVATYCIGEASSMAALLLAAGTPGKRYALPSARVMIHQPWGGAEGDARAIEIQAREINRLKALIYGRLARHTKKSMSKITTDCDRDYFMSAEEAKAYGLVDKILITRRAAK